MVIKDKSVFRVLLIFRAFQYAPEREWHGSYHRFADRPSQSV